MIYSRPEADALVDQGDIIDDCPILVIGKFDASTLEFEVVSRLFRVIVLTQACDLANRKVSMANVALVYSAEDLIEKGVLKSAEVRGPIRAGRVFGYYFLSRSPGTACRSRSSICAACIQFPWTIWKFSARQDGDLCELSRCTASISASTSRTRSVELDFHYHTSPFSRQETPKRRRHEPFSKLLPSRADELG